MKSLFKIFLAAMVMIFGLMPAMAFQFPDVAEDYWAASQIELLTDQGVIVGYPDGTFKPDENVTRAEFATMAIKALGQENANVAQPVNFTDITPEYWAYDSIQKALYFDLISAEQNGGEFRPDDSVSRAEATTVAINALTTEQISPAKAREVLMKKYVDANTISDEFLIAAGKSEILGMIVVEPSNEQARLEADRPATRAELAAILFNMIEQAKLNPNAKLAEAMRKKTGEGYVVENAVVQGSIGIIPAGAAVPVKLTKDISSQTSNSGDVYIALAPQNYITSDKFILVAENSRLKGQLLDVRSGKWFVRNGVLALENTLIATNNDQVTNFPATGEVTKERNWFMKLVRATLKGEKLEADASEIIYMRVLKPIKVDLTNGWIYE